ncbi:MAG: hypothetical protein LUG51_17265 [Tannerellaceae bacterium]|nr:hypothetical protein [Tannerellaceae bacterium]
MKPYRSLVKVIFLFFLVAIVLMPLRGGYVRILTWTGLPLSSLVGFVIYYLILFFLLRKSYQQLSPEQILICGIIGVSILNLPLHIIYFYDTLVSLPEYIIHILGMGLGYIAYKLRNKYAQILFTIFTLLLGYLLSIECYQYWFSIKFLL